MARRAVVAGEQERLRFEVPAEESGRRLDRLLVDRLPHSSRARVGRLFATGRVHLADAKGRPCRATKGHRVEAGEMVVVDLGAGIQPGGQEPAAPEPNAPLVVVLERKDLVVVDKPAGQPCAPLAAGELGTLANALVAQYPEMAEVGFRPSEPGLCHRLDNDTSGLLLAARDAASFRNLRDALVAGRLSKRYLLVCAERGLPDAGTIDLPLRPHPQDRHRVMVVDRGNAHRAPAGRPATTSFRVLTRQGSLALVEARVARALRHQIRAHFAAIGHPLAGDQTYRSSLLPELGRQALHASQLRYRGDRHTAPWSVCSELPPDLQRLFRPVAPQRDR